LRIYALGAEIVVLPEREDYAQSGKLSKPVVELLTVQRSVQKGLPEPPHIHPDSLPLAGARRHELMCSQ
jgi:hypothetical protein